ncbi:MAG TPA: biotin--[acetyl-CoA-carboxylase] ligase [Desulfotomaculum sp.]|nr:biotin--[acetyl-CoA-carboxylase] ligase [Desulfotomaculum sp.]HCJ79005.1 biotin--[acetyl-CoA-carboxylase] ligase [Desulfotomaculum sp.]
MKKQILYILKNGYPRAISGESICKALGVSRTSIWKHIQALRKDGYEIVAQPNVGYRLVTVPDFLYPEEVTYNLTTEFLGRTVYYYKEVNSTNQIAKDLALQGAADGSLVVAETQSAGRGRLSRGWFSPYGKGLWCSVILYPKINPVEVPPITMLASVAIAQAIREVVGIKAGIKWPNDICLKGKKVCGILTEMGAEMERVRYLVLGIGLNVNIEAEDLPSPLKEVATSLKIESGQPVNRLHLLQVTLKELEKLYFVWLEEGFAPILIQWKKLCVHLPGLVRLSNLKESWEGWTEDVDLSGALLLRLSTGEIRRFITGEISLTTGYGQAGCLPYGPVPREVT